MSVRDGARRRRKAGLCAMAVLAAAAAPPAHGAAVFSAPGPNVALHKPYTLDPQPNYDYCTDPGDAKQLTDGETVQGRFWTQPGCVGWNGAGLVTVTIDLGTSTPVGGLAFNTVAGAAGVSWPSAILVLVSDDGTAFRLAGELCVLSARFGVPTPGKLETHRFRTDALRTQGRFLRLGIAASGPYVFCDEVEVYRGPDELLKQPAGGSAVPDLHAFVGRHRAAMAIRKWVVSDIAHVRRAVAEAGVEAGVRQRLNEEIAAVEEANRVLPDAPAADYRGIYPLTDDLGRLGEIVARLRRAEGCPSLFLWHNNRWDLLGPWDCPPEAPGERPALTVRLMANERRGATLNVANFTDETLSAKVRIAGLPGGSTPAYLTVKTAEYVAIQSGAWNADALPDAPRGDDGWTVTLHPGISRQLWLGFYPVDDPPPGRYQGEVLVEVEALDRRLTSRLELVVEPFRMPDDRTVALTMWDYTSGGGRYDLTPGNVRAAVAHMRSYHYNAPWAGHEVFPQPKADDFDAANNLIVAPDFSTFDEWVVMWPDARYYMVFIEGLVGRFKAGFFAGTAEGTPEFDQRLGAAVRAWAGHAREVGVDPNRIALLIIDEPGGAEQARRVLAWARAIKAGAPELRIYEDPHIAPHEADGRKMLEACDIICPPIGRYRAGGGAMAAPFEELRRGGRELWFYSSPTVQAGAYHRDHLWECWKARATGIGFWSYASASGIGNTWNHLGAKGPIYSPVYIDSTSVTDGKRWLAIIEGIQDYEYLRMLRDRVEELEAAERGSAAVNEAKELLNRLPDDVLRGDVTFDAGRLLVLDALSRLRGAPHPTRATRHAAPAIDQDQE